MWWKRFKLWWFGPIYLNLRDNYWPPGTPLWCAPMVWDQRTWDQTVGFLKKWGKLSLEGSTGVLQSEADLRTIPSFERASIRFAVDAGPHTAAPEGDIHLVYSLMLGTPSYMQLWMNTSHGTGDPVDIRNGLAKIWEDTAKRRMPLRRIYRIAGLLAVLVILAVFVGAAISLFDTGLLVSLAVGIIGIGLAVLVFNWFRAKADAQFKHKGRWASLDFRRVIEPDEAKRKRERNEKVLIALIGPIIGAAVTTAIFLINRR